MNWNTLLQSDGELWFEQTFTKSDKIMNYHWRRYKRSGKTQRAISRLFR